MQIIITNNSMKIIEAALVVSVIKSIVFQSQSAYI